MVQIHSRVLRLRAAYRLGPRYHWAPHRIHAHVALTDLALLLERIARHACDDTWCNTCDELKQIKLAQLFSPKGTLWQVTKAGPNAANLLNYQS